MTTSRQTQILFALSLGLLGSACGGDGGSKQDDADPDAGIVDEECDPGTQDQDGDGVCLPDCTQTACENGTCAIDDGTAICSCKAGFAGDACDELATPSAADTVFWVDAADSSTIVNHAGFATVESWTDRSSAGLVGSTEEVASSPVVIADGQNGLPVLRFDGDDDHVTFPGLTGVTGSDYTVFFVVRQGDNAGTAYSAEGPGFERFEGNVSPTLLAHYHDANGNSSDVSIESSEYGDSGWSGEFHLVTVRVRSQDVSIWVDGNHMIAEPRQSPDKITETPLTMTLGGRDGGNEFAGDIAEMIIVADALHYAERLPYEDYLAAKWFGVAFERTPSAFGTTMIWLDASDSDSLNLVNGSSVLGWANRGIDEGGFDNGAFAESRPQLVENAMGGHPVVRFDGADALVQNGIDIRTAGAEGQYSIIAVIAPPSTGPAHRLFRANHAQDDERVLQLDLDGEDPGLTYLHRWPSGDVGGDQMSLVSLDFSGPTIVKIERTEVAGYHVSAGAAYAQVEEDIATNMPDGDDLNWVLGGESISEPGAGFTGDIAEFIVLGNVLDNSEETALLEMLRAKWGL